MNGKGLTQEEIDEIRGIIETMFYPMWLDALDEMEQEETQTTARIFAELSGASWQSPLAMAFVMFSAGIDKGMTLQEKLSAL